MHPLPDKKYACHRLCANSRRPDLIPTPVWSSPPEPAFWLPTAFRPRIQNSQLERHTCEPPSSRAQPRVKGPAQKPARPMERKLACSPALRARRTYQVLASPKSRVTRWQMATYCRNQVGTMLRDRGRPEYECKGQRAQGSRTASCKKSLSVRDVF